MNLTLFFALAAEATYLFPSLKWKPISEHLPLPDNLNNTWVYILIIISNPLIIFWLYNAFLNDHHNKIKIKAKEKLVKFLILRKCPKSDNLNEKFGDKFKDNKDIYYLDSHLILKTANGDTKRYPGYYLETTRFNYCYLHLKFILPSIFEMKPFMILLAGLVTLLFFVTSLVYVF